MLSGFSFSDLFAAMLALQRAMESRFQTDWMGTRTTGSGSYPPIEYVSAGRRPRRR